MDILNINLWSLLAGAIVFLTLLIFVPMLVREYLGVTPWWFQRRLNAVWDEVGQRIGFQRLGGPRLTGNRRERAVDLRTEKVMAADGTHEGKFITTVEVKLESDLWSALKVRPRGLVGKLERIATGDLAEQYGGGEKSHAIGDWEFDNDFFVGGRVDEAAEAALRQPELQRALREASIGEGTYEIRFGVMRFHIDRGIDQGDELVRIIDRCLDGADGVERTVAEVDRRSVEEELFPEVV